MQGGGYLQSGGTFSVLLQELFSSPNRKTIKFKKFKDLFLYLMGKVGGSTH